MRFWRWLVTPDPAPGFTRPKLLRLLVRVLLFTVVATLLSALLRALGLGTYLDTWWGTLIFVLVLYIPLFRFLSVDTFVPARMAARTSAARPDQKGQKGMTSAERRRERNRYAGIRKGPPRGGTGRR